ncbi:MAG: putative phage lambda repressor protein [Pedosphaera sp.]|nr:putative phage lambda repressor protein [Pedosphaera sp.]
MSQEALGALLGVSANYVSMIENGRVPGAPTLKLFETLEASPKYGGTNGHSQSDNPLKPLNGGTPPVYSPTAKKAVTRKVPVVSWARAGQAHDYADLANQIEEEVESETKDPHAFALIVEGDSMEPEIFAGDIIIFSPSSEPRNGNIVVARLLEDHGVLLKRFRRKGPEGKVVRLESSNIAYEPKEYPYQSFRFIFPAVELKRQLRR